MATSYNYSQGAIDNLSQSEQNLEDTLASSSGSYSDSLNPSK